jgi:ubiquinone/menaquinone biosynthesis C-methylase UbiE
MQRPAAATLSAVREHPIRLRPCRTGNVSSIRPLLLLGLLLVLLFDAPVAWTQRVEPAPPASRPTHYRGREIAQTMHYLGAPWLTRESRQREEDCETMLRELRLRPGMLVCDLGCGNGFYTLRLAKSVEPEGRVLAVDIQSEMLRLMEARAAEIPLRNIDSVLGTEVDPKLPEAAVDLVLCVDVYHEFSYPEVMLTHIRKALKPDGDLVLVEFREEDSEVPIKPLHKMSKQQILKELLPNGFRLAREFDDLPWQHMMFFRRTADAPATDPE